MTYIIQTEQEVDGRWMADISMLPGVLAYGQTKEEAIAKAEALAMRVVAERIEQGEAPTQSVVAFRAA